MDPARVLREARLRMGLSQADLARRLGIPAPAISRIENRRVTPRVDTLDHLLEACGAGLAVEQRLGAGVDRDKIREPAPCSPGATAALRPPQGASLPVGTPRALRADR
jgi:transcriptional regulator with XRE-family HTH domain